MTKFKAGNGGPPKRLTQEERMAIPGLYIATGSKLAVARAMGCQVETVERWLENLSGEEYDHLKEGQRKELLTKSIDILYKALDLTPEKLGDASMRDLMGVVKIMADRIALWGGVGSVDSKQGEVEGDLESLLAAAEAKRRQAAIDEALKTGSLEPLKAFAVK